MGTKARVAILTLAGCSNPASGNNNPISGTWTKSGSTYNWSLSTVTFAGTLSTASTLYVVVGGTGSGSMLLTKS